MQHPLIYFCNIHTKQLQYTSEISETIETYICNVGGERPAPVDCADGVEPVVSASTSGAREHQRHQHRAWLGGDSGGWGAGSAMAARVGGARSPG
jgi:hypothetical protein